MITAIILAGGKGTRVMGAACPKQYIMIGGHQIIWYVLKTVIYDNRIDQFVVVADPDRNCEIREIIDSISKDSNRKSITVLFAESGKTRQLSILNALNEINAHSSESVSGDDLVAVIDGVRPNMTEKLLNTCLDAAAEADGAMPALSMKDTIYFTNGNGKITELIERSKVCAGQAPEIFRFRKYLDANNALSEEQIFAINGSTEPAVMAGMDIRIVAGDEHNYKITTDGDLRRFREEYEKEHLQ